MFITKCQYMLSCSEKMAKNVLRKIKEQPYTIMATLKKIDDGYLMSCTFIGKHVPIWVMPLINRVISN